MGKIKKIFTSARIIILLIVLLLSVVAIHPSFHEGVAIRNVEKNSAAFEAGIPNPPAKITPVARERILEMNGIPIKNEKDYYDFIQTLTYNQTIRIKTSDNIYILTTKPKYKITELNETETVIKEVFNNETNSTETVTKEVPKIKKEITGMEDLGITVFDAPNNNLRKGLDLSGGTRALLKPTEKVSEDDLQITIDNIKERLNVFGLSDIIVRNAKDLSGNDYILVEIAGVSEKEVKDLIARQGKFEAKIGNKTVFRGSSKDITYVCRTSQCSGIDPQRGCSNSGKEWFCNFQFAITLSKEAAKKHSQITEKLGTVTENGQSYLNESLDLFLDDQLTDSLRVAADLKGREVTDIAISGSGSGATRADAISNSLLNMKKLQTILITGSLPVKLEVVKIDSISPALGKTFIKNILIVGLLAILAVALVILIRYRKIIIGVPVIITMLSEVVALLGFAAVVGWNLDLAAIAGILIAVGTGVDDQIVIVDETLKGSSEESGNWKEKLKKAFFIIMGAYFTSLAAMVPLMFAGAGLVKGFAITTIVGISIGVFITRPAFAKLTEILLNKE